MAARRVPDLRRRASAAPSAVSLEELLARIDDRSLVVGVLGLGAVGLPLSRTFARAGFRVLGFDHDAEKRAALARGAGAPAHLGPAFVRELLDGGRFEIVADRERLTEVGAALVCVPTPLDARGGPDLGAVLDVGGALARWLPDGALAVLVSTAPPGTARGPFARALAARPRPAGGALLVASAPEREDPGRDVATWTVPKLVGGTCGASAQAAARLHAAAFDRVVPVSSAEVAEAAKLLENVYRAVNIALVNEVKVALDALAIDISEVVEAAATKPFGFERFQPGPGTGGHCIPMAAPFLAAAARGAGVELPLVAAATAAERDMPAWVVAKAGAALASVGRGLCGARVLVLGLAYKRGVDCTSRSPALSILELLLDAGAHACFSDPHVPVAPDGAALAGSARRSVALDAASLAEADVVIVATDHATFDWEIVARHARLVVDARRVLVARLSGDARYWPA